jgi:hypothetical protein
VETRRSRLPRIVLVLALLALALVPAALAGRGGGTSTGSCTPNAPGVAVQNTYGWGQSGSWGLPGQQLGYQIRVDDLDAGCGSTSFALSVSAPDGFTVSIPTSAVSLRPGNSAYVWAYVTSPASAADGDYPLTVTVTRSASGAAATQSSLYRVYSSDGPRRRCSGRILGTAQLSVGAPTTRSSGRTTTTPCRRSSSTSTALIARHPRATASPTTARCPTGGHCVTCTDSTRQRSSHTTGWAMLPR